MTFSPHDLKNIFEKEKTMKRNRSVALFAIFLASIFCAGSAAAQGISLVEIYNNSGEERKACMYPADDPVAAIPIECFEMDHKEIVVWIRQNDRSNFRLKIFRMAPDFRIRHDRVLPGATTHIMIQASELAISPDLSETAFTKYRLKVCNQRFDEKIFFALSFETNFAFLTEGWWSVEKGKCVEIPVSKRLSNNMSLPYGNLPRTYFYARTHSAKPQFWYWSGAGEGKSFCIKEKNAFKISGKRGPVGDPPPCTASNMKTAAFRRIADPNPNEDIYYLNF